MPAVPLPIARAAARAVGSVSRLAGTGGGTTLPGKLLSVVDPGSLDRLAARLPAGAALVSATNGKTTTAAMAAEILRPRFRLAHNASGANLISGVTSALLAAPEAELALLEVDEAALPLVAARVKPRLLCLGNLFRDQLDRYGELELVAERWRRAVRELPEAARLVVNADDPQVGDLAGERPATTFGLNDPAVARPGMQHAADSKWCVRCGTPYHYDATYVGHLGVYRCPKCGHSRPRVDVAAHDVELRRLEGTAFTLATPDGSRRVELALPGVYNVYNALAAAALARELGASLDDVVAGLGRFRAAFGRFERITVADRSVVMLLVKNPAGANEAVRTLVEGDAPSLAVLALNDEIADGQDVSWIWDVDFEPLMERLERAVVTGSRAAELALRFKYAGFAEHALEVIPDLARALDRGLALTPAGGELVVLPTYTAMLALRRLMSERGHVAQYWEATAR